MGVEIEVLTDSVRVSGIDPLALNDLVMDAPEPPLPGQLLRPTAANLLYLYGGLPHAYWIDFGQRLMEARAHRYVEALHREEPDKYEREWPFKVEPKPYQLKIFAVARRLPYFALAPCAPGTGKTKMALDIAADKYMRGEIDCVAVVSGPRGVHRQWVNSAIPEHMTDAVRYVAAVWSPTRKTPKPVMNKHNKVLRILSFNIEAFSAKSGKAAKALMDFMETGRCFLIEDESSRIKSPDAARTKAFIGTWHKGKHKPGLTSFAVCRCILTGTPITKGIEDLWAQYEFLDPGIIGMSNYYAFRARYCVLAPAFARAEPWRVKIVGYRNTEEFVRKIAGVTFVVPKDVLGLPAKSYEVLPVELTKEQKKAYRAMRDKVVAEMKEAGLANPTNAAVRVMRLQQLLCGRVYAPGATVEEPAVLTTIPSYRLDTLLQYIDANARDRPTVIWSRFTQDILDIDKALREAGRRPVTYYGATSDELREAAVSALQRGAATDFIANPACAGMGIDGLQHVAEIAIYYSNSFNREHRWQSEDRIHRLGMRGTALYVDLVAPGTVDRMVLDSFKTTEDLIATLLKRPELIPILNDEE